MNTQGWLRALITKNSDTDKFMRFVCNTISKEFEISCTIVDNNSKYSIMLANYNINISKFEAERLQKHSPYTLDKYLLESLKKQGMQVDKNRSQYTRYCYGVIPGKS